MPQPLGDRMAPLRGCSVSERREPGLSVRFQRFSPAVRPLPDPLPRISRLARSGKIGYMMVTVPGFK